MTGQKDQVLSQTEKLGTKSLELAQGHTVGRMEELGTTAGNGSLSLAPGHSSPSPS